MPVSTRHPDYAKMLPKWELMRDVLEETVKEKEKTYLPETAGQKAVDIPEIYQSYLARADFQSFTSDSSRSMMGLVSRLETNIELPSKLKELEENATADGFGLKQLFSRVVDASLGYGRQGLLVDFDHDSEPYIAYYDTFSIINWKSTNNNGRKDLTLVVLAEQWLKETNDEFDHDTETVYRVLDLDERGKYRVRVFKDESLNVPYETKENLLGDLDYIPFIFVGSTDTSPNINPIPLWTMGKCAIKQYQISADYYHDLHLTCHPQPWVSGLAVDEKIEYSGANMIWKIPQGGNCGYLEISGNGIERNRIAMSDLKSVALESGARVIDIGVESGEARQARQNDQYATLHSLVSVAVNAINQALKYICEVVHLKTDKDLFAVTIDFRAAGVDASILTSLLSAAMANKISMASYWEYIRTGKIPERTYEEEQKLIAEQQDNEGLQLDEPETT